MFTHTQKCICVYRHVCVFVKRNVKLPVRVEISAAAAAKLGDRVVFSFCRRDRRNKKTTTTLNTQKFVKTSK